MLPQKQGKYYKEHNTRQSHLLTRLPAVLPPTPISGHLEPSLASTWASQPELSFLSPLDQGSCFKRKLCPSVVPNNIRDGMAHWAPHS